MIEYANQSSICTVLFGFHLDPHNKDGVQWIQQYPHEWKERDAYGNLVAPYMAYSLVMYCITPIQE